MKRGLLLSALTGAIALSYEILWARLYSYATGAVSNSFGLMLGSYLLGIGLGSLLAGKICEERDLKAGRLQKRLAVFVGLANLTGFLLAPIVSWLVLGMHPYWTLPLLTVCAGMLGAAFPLITHISIAPDEQAGLRLGWVYLANIAGSSAGSLLTGFVLLDTLQFSTISALLFAAGAALSLALYLPLSQRGRTAIAASAASLCVLLFAARHAVFDGMYERLQWKSEIFSKPGGLSYRFARIYESKSGVIAIGPDGSIHGGGMYDGYLETGVRRGTWLLRPYSLTLFHPAPKRILVVGVSGGAWTAILAGHPGVESITAVEINRQYRQVIADHPAMKHLLEEKKVRFVFDDGRRWMVHNPGERFDAVVMNTTYHFRSYVSNLLSREYMTLVKERLNQGGIFLFNTTDSREAMRTALEVFADCRMVLNAAVCSTEPLRMDPERWMKNLDRVRINGRPVFEKADEQETKAWLRTLPAGMDRVEPIYEREAFRSKERMIEETRGSRIVTDDNMATENSVFFH